MKRHPRNLFDHETAEMAREYLVGLDADWFFGEQPDNLCEDDEVITRPELEILIYAAGKGDKYFRLLCERVHTERLHQQLGYFVQADAEGV